MRLGPRPVASIALALLVAAGSPARAQFAQTNLVSDVQGNAAHFDPNIKNAWGVSFAPGGPFWVSNAGTNTSTLYDATGAINSLVVAIPTTGTGPQGPTGQVFTGGLNFGLSNGSAALFVFADLNGHIYGWNGAAGTTALLAGTGTAGASYDGLALGVSALGNTLYAANNAGTGGVDVFNSSFAQVTLAGNFTDPNLPAGFHPYNVQNIGGTLYVTYNSAAGGGVVDTFDQNGNFLARIASNDATGPLSAPWGVAIAPTGFGTLGGDILVGNRGNGMIDIFSPAAGHAFLGTLNGLSGSPIVNAGLWDLTFDATAQNAPPGPPTLYIAAGPAGYSQGLLAAINPVPEPSSIALCGVGAAGLGVWLRRRK